MPHRSCRSRLAIVLVLGVGISACGRTARTPEPAVATPEVQPQAPSTPGASPGRVVSATRFETRPCQGETAIPPDVDRILSELESPTREHCELHALPPGGPQLLFVRTMNTVAHDDAGDPIPTCSWEVFAVPPRSVAHLATLSMCQFAIDEGCIYDLDQTSQASTPSVCIDADGRLVTPER